MASFTSSVSHSDDAPDITISATVQSVLGNIVVLHGARYILSVYVNELYFRMIPIDTCDKALDNEAKSRLGVILKDRRLSLATAADISDILDDVENMISRIRTSDDGDDYVTADDDDPDADPETILETARDTLLETASRIGTAIYQAKTASENLTKYEDWVASRTTGF